MPYRHVVLFRVHDGVANSRVAHAIAQLESLATLPQVMSLFVAPSLDGRKGRVIVEDATFADAAAFTAFRTAPTHIAVGAAMAEISDWWIGDFEQD